MSHAIDSRITNAKSELEFHVMYALYSKCDSACASPALCRRSYIADAAKRCLAETAAILTLCDQVENSTKLTKRQKARMAEQIRIKASQHTTWSLLLTKKREELANACCFCEGDVGEYGGNNPTPLAGDKCCDSCNKSKVIPARMALFTSSARRRVFT